MKKLFCLVLAGLLAVGSCFAEFSQSDISKIKSALFETYANKENLSEEDFNIVTDEKTLNDFFKKNIKNDTHFLYKYFVKSLGYYTFWERYTEQIKDAPDFKDNTEPYFEYIQTKKTEYVKCRSCDITNAEFLDVMNKVQGNKKFIILDFRSNRGGSQSPIFDLMERLLKINYKGTIIALQDNYSYSSGEVWNVIGREKYNCFKSILIGPHSGGMQSFANCVSVEVTLENGDNISIFMPTNVIPVPSKFEGEGIGYKPDIFISNIDELNRAIKKVGCDFKFVEE